MIKRQKNDCHVDRYVEKMQVCIELEMSEISVHTNLKCKTFVKWLFEN